MRHLRIFFLAALATAALALCASSASATVLCKTNTTPCTSQVTTGTKVEMSLSGTSVLKTGFATVECSGSEINGTVENAGGVSSTVSGKVETLKFSSCNCPVTTVKSGSVEAHHTGGSMNGTVTSAGAEVTALCSGVTCTYGTGAATNLGTLTGGEPAKLDVSASLAKTAGGFLCASTASWTATYEVKTPKPLYVAESASTAQETALTTSLSGEGKSGETITVLEGSKVKDTATLSGNNASKATGTVEYKVYADSSCKELVTSAGSVTVTAGSVPASNEVELTAGAVYYWQASYSGDTNNLSSTSVCGKEIVTVKANTSLTTSLSGGGQSGVRIEVEEEDAVKDTATLSGTNVSKATGKVKYNVYSDSECKELVTSAGEVSVSGASVPSSNEVELPDGFYYWQASYGGDSTHSASAGACGDEIELVAEETTLTTSLSGGGESGEEIEVEEGELVFDQATLSGSNASEATGHVAYLVYADSECEELAAEAGVVTLTPESEEEPIPASVQVQLPQGTYYWRAEYFGDSLNRPATSACGDEVVVVNPPPLTTTLSGGGTSGAEITVDEETPVTDTATLHIANASTATGKVKYNVYSDEECEELVKSAGEVTLLMGGVVPASNEVTLSAGVYYWQAEYLGDLSHPAATSVCGDEIEVVGAETSLSTSLSGGEESGEEIEVQEGVGVSDSATLSGANASEAGGIVEYEVYADSKCEELAAFAGSVEVSEGEVPDSEEVFLPAGTYYWQAIYFGDSSNQGSVSTCGDEVLEVSPASLTLELTGEGEQGPEIEVGAETPVIGDATLNIENVETATGTVKYNVYSDEECEELVKSAGEVTVAGGVIPPSTEQALSEGTYYWQAVYSGDKTHASATSLCGKAVEQAKAIWIVSVGDSYISGEGGRWAGNVAIDTKGEMSKRIDALKDTAYRNPHNDEEKGEAIPLCHRSKTAEIFIGPQVKSKNLACSGAKTFSSSTARRVIWGFVLKESVFTPGLDFADGVKGGWVNRKDDKQGPCWLTVCKGQATQLQEFAEARKKNKEQIKMIVLSIGGNDFDFPGVVKKCVIAFAKAKKCSEDKAIKKQFEAAAATAIQAEIKQAIERIGEAMTKAKFAENEFTILVQDYPSPLPANGAEFRHGGLKRVVPDKCPFMNDDAKWANETALKTINETVKKAAEEAGKKYTVKRLQLETAFEKRRLCLKGLKLVGEDDIPDWQAKEAANKSEWINQIRPPLAELLPGAPKPPLLPEYLVQEDFHPNYWGQLALRRCVRLAYNNGTPKGGKCVLEKDGLATPPGRPPNAPQDTWPPEPIMKLE